MALIARRTEISTERTTIIGYYTKSSKIEIIDYCKADDLMYPQ